MARSTDRVQVKALGQVGGDGAGQGAAGAVGVGVVDAAFRGTTCRCRIPPQQVVGVVDLVAALAQHGAAVLLADGPGRRLHVRRRCVMVMPERISASGMLGVSTVARGSRSSLQGGDRVLRDEPGPGGGHHHRVHHQMFLASYSLQLGRDDGG